MAQYQPRMGSAKETPTKPADPQKAQHRGALETLADWSRENAAAEHTNRGERQHRVTAADWGNKESVE